MTNKELLDDTIVIYHLKSPRRENPSRRIFGKYCNEKYYNLKSTTIESLPKMNLDSKDLKKFRELLIAAFKNDHQIPKLIIE